MRALALFLVLGYFGTGLAQAAEGGQCTSAAPDFQKLTALNDALQDASSRTLPLKLKIRGCSELLGDGSDFTKLKAQIALAANQGLSCLGNLGEKSSEKSFHDQQRLEGILSSREVNLLCGKAGEQVEFAGLETLPSDAYSTTDPTQPDYPGITLADTLPFEAAKDPLALQGLLFHEMLHWLGYTHKSGIDVPYLAGVCCLGYPRTDQPTAKVKACELLKNRPDPESSAYQSAFAQVLLGTSSKHVVIQAWLRPFHAGSLIERKKSLAALHATVQGLEETLPPALHLILTQATAPVELNASAAPTSPEKNEFARFYGSVLRGHLLGHRLATERLLRDGAKKYASTDCKFLNTDEKRLLRLLRMNMSDQGTLAELSGNERSWFTSICSDFTL